MKKSFVINFFRENNPQNHPDFAERFGNFGLAILRIGIGKTVIIQKIPGKSNQLSFKEKTYSTTAKVSSIALFCLAFPITIFLSITGYIAILSSKSYINIFNLYHQTLSSNSSNKEDLWNKLEKKTQPALKSVEFLGKETVNHRFNNVDCPKETAITVSGKSLHANKVGKGITQHSFIASQAPLPEDYEIFWNAIFEQDSIIFDLTTIKDQVDGGVTKYYPEKLNEPMKCGAISIELTQENDSIYTYEIKDTRTGILKTTQRFHYTNWKDFDSVSLPTLELLVKKAESLSLNLQKPIWIHCRAGVGRTGTLITSLIIKEKIEKGEITKENLNKTLIDNLITLRQHRGPLFVQKKDQLELVIQYANELISRKNN